MVGEGLCSGGWGTRRGAMILVRTCVTAKKTRAREPYDVA